MAEVHELHVWDWDTEFTKEQILRMASEIDETGHHFETRHRRKDGSLCDVELSNNGFVYGDEKLTFHICREITERKRAEAEREKLICELQDASKEI